MLVPQPTPYPTGRLAIEDPRSAHHLMAMVIEPKPLEALPKKMYHQPGPVINQQGSSCVGASSQHLLECTPIPVTVGQPGYLNIYKGALDRDHIPGTADTGTTIIAGMKYLQEIGKIERYVWAESMDSLVRWILTQGPVIMGTLWRDQMWETDSRGVIRSAGNVVGGHAWMVYGYENGWFRCQQSWGSNWGLKGRFWVYYTDMKKMLMDEAGEACSPSETGM